MYVSLCVHVSMYVCRHGWVHACVYVQAQVHMHMYKRQILTQVASLVAF